jgi:hypothetical protein
MYRLRLCNEYIKAVDAFIDLGKKDMLTTLEGIFVVLANVAGMRRDITHMMC